MAEGDRHKKLKLIAAEFLRRLGCVQIEMEVRPKIRKPWLAKRRVPNVSFDVVGRLNGKRIVVECGGCYLKNRSTWVNSRRIYRLYILPYGETEPYEWKPRMEICRHCGHIMGEYNQH